MCSTVCTAADRWTSRSCRRATSPSVCALRGAGIGAFYCPTGVGTLVAEGKEVRTIDGRDYVLEYPIRGDVALIGAYIGDRARNLLYRKTARNFGPVMATAAELTIAEVSKVFDIGEIDPENVITPGIFVDRILEVSR
jgi:3-oxoadipate CoA-transferase, alpha subunit